MGKNFSELQDYFTPVKVPLVTVALFNLLWMAALTLYYYSRVHRLYEKSFHLFITGLVVFSLLVQLAATLMLFFEFSVDTQAKFMMLYKAIVVMVATWLMTMLLIFAVFAVKQWNLVRKLQHILGRMKNENFQRESTCVQLGIASLMLMTYGLLIWYFVALVQLVVWQRTLLALVIASPALFVTAIQLQTYTRLEAIAMNKYQISKGYVRVEISALLVIEICCILILVLPIERIIACIICGVVAISLISLRSALLIV